MMEKLCSFYSDSFLRHTDSPQGEEAGKKKKRLPSQSVSTCERQAWG